MLTETRVGCAYLAPYIKVYVNQNQNQNIRIFNGLEKGTYAPNNNEQAFVQREETKD